MNRITKAMQHAVNQHEYDTSVQGGTLPEVTVVGKDPKISDEQRQANQEAAFKKANGNVTHEEFLMRPELREQKFNDLENYYKEKGYQYNRNPISGKPELISPDTKWDNGTISESNPSFSEKVWQAVAPDRTEGNFTTYLHTHPGVDNLLTAAGTAATGNALWKFGQSAIQGGRYLLPQIPNFMRAIKTNPARAIGTGLGLVGTEILPRTAYGYAVNKASNALTGQSFGKNVATVLPGSDEGVVGELKEQVGDFTNPGYSFRFGNTAIGKRAMESVMRTGGVNPIPEIVDAFVQPKWLRFGGYNPGKFMYPLRYILTGKSKIPETILIDNKTGKVVKNPKASQVGEQGYPRFYGAYSQIQIDPMRKSHAYERYFPTWQDKLKLALFPKRYTLAYSSDNQRGWTPHFDRTGFYLNNPEVDQVEGINGDLIDAYVYNKQIDPKIATEMGKDWPHFSGNQDGKQPRVYQLNDWRDQTYGNGKAAAYSHKGTIEVQAHEPVVASNSEAKELMQNGSRATFGSSDNAYYYDQSGYLRDPSFEFGRNGEAYDAGGYLVHKFWPKSFTKGNITMKSDDSPMLVAEDIWRFNPWRYGKRWLDKANFSLGAGKAISSDFGKGLGSGSLIGWLDKYGHPFIMQSKPIYSVAPKGTWHSTPNPAGEVHSTTTLSDVQPKK